MTVRPQLKSISVIQHDAQLVLVRPAPDEAGPGRGTRRAGRPRAGCAGGDAQCVVGRGGAGSGLVACDPGEEKTRARQFAYGQGDVGRSKVKAARDWAARYSPETTVDAIHEQIDDAESIRRLGAGT